MESHLSRAGSSAADSISFILKIKCKVKKDQDDVKYMSKITYGFLFRSLNEEIRISISKGKSKNKYKKHIKCHQYLSFICKVRRRFSAAFIQESDLSAMM